MATLILTAVGTAIGGPIGGAIGAAIGQSVDQRLFAPKARHGPRLGELAVQTSSYGTQIPKIFGAMRAAGTVIWSTDLVERRSTSGGGKGRPKTVNYSYSASFAVALSGRRVREVRRIWADGKLLRGAAGDFKAATGFRLYPGDEDQEPDPLIAAAEGVSQTPAFRGLAYAVFEDLQLADYGNRIPSLTFEIVAETEPIEIGAIAEELASGAIEAGVTPALAGYAAGGDSVRAAVETLTDVVPLTLADGAAALRLSAGEGEGIPIPAEEESERREIIRRGQAAVPGEASIAYYDLERDYQTGLQRAVRIGGRTADHRALAAAISAADAKALAEYRLAAIWAGRTRAVVKTNWRTSGLRPGARVSLDAVRTLWRVERWTLDAAAVTLDLAAVSSGVLPVLSASPGRALSESDLRHGPTLLRLLDFPLGNGQIARPLLYIAAAGTEQGWRRAGLSVSYDAGASWQDAGGTAAPAIVGTTQNALGPAGSALFDAGSSLEIELAHEGMWLESRGDDALADGANLAVIGDELIQFGIAEPIGARRFRLSRLLRGRRGTEPAAAGHGVAEPFTLIETESLAVLEAPAGSLGGEARILASGVGDLPAAVEASMTIVGADLLPPSPVHLRARETEAGDLAIEWVRRSRQGWTWVSGSDIALGEESERYRLVINGPGFERVAETIQSHYLYTAAQRGEDGAGPIEIAVAQIGTFASSRPASLIVS